MKIGVGFSLCLSRDAGVSLSSGAGVSLQHGSLRLLHRLVPSHAPAGRVKHRTRDRRGNDEEPTAHGALVS